MGFDCASISELRTVLGMGVSPSRIVFANPCKSAISLQFASNMGVLKTTFDNSDELDKIKQTMPNAELILRIHACDETALVNFGEKFGATQNLTLGLLRNASDLGLNVIGVSFHVGE
jgi:ornithine decarboxylase